MFYRDQEEMLATVGPFMQIGLLRGERNLCILPQPYLESLLQFLQAAGVDTEKEIERGALVPVTVDAYLTAGHFNRDRIVALLEETIRESLAKGFTGFRAVGDLTWSSDHVDCCAQIPEYEKFVDRYYPTQPALGICLYDARRFSEKQLKSIMKTHRLALTSPTPSTRAMRIRKGNAYGDVVFDKQLPTIFHYTVQRDDSREIVSVGQEQSLTAAIEAVESELSPARAAQSSAM